MTPLFKNEKTCNKQALHFDIIFLVFASSFVFVAYFYSTFGIFHNHFLCTAWTTVITLAFLAMLYSRTMRFHLIIVFFLWFSLFFIDSVSPGGYWPPLSFNRMIVSVFESVFLLLATLPAMVSARTLRAVVRNIASTPPHSF